MTKEQLLTKAKQLIETNNEYMYKLINKAIVSGCMDIEGAPDDFQLPSYLVTAIYQQMVYRHGPAKKDKKGVAEVENILSFI